jgi:hypothetical protein
MQLPSFDAAVADGRKFYATLGSGSMALAVNSKESADYTVHIVLGLDSQLRLFLVDMWRRKTSFGRMGRSVLRHGAALAVGAVGT